ncbi:MAG: DNA polymerase, partial [Polymorphobacter sp.]
QLMAADYNQIELRLVAHIADVPELKRVYAEGGDVHALTAQEVFGEVTRDTRARAKTINFSIIYGISAFGLAARLGIDRGEAARYIELYFSRFPGIRNYMGETIAAAKEHGYVTTLFGRKCHVPFIFSKNQGERQFAERAAVNARVQGTAADIIKRAMAQMPGALAATSTGRLSSNDPNLQNIPIRTEMGRKIRYAFVAEPGHTILAADYNQIELRLVAAIADEPALKAVYAAGGDVHALTAQEVFGEVTRDTRARAKTINFSIIYGISAFGLAQRLGIDRGEAARYIELYFARFPGIRRYMAETIQGAKDCGYVSTLFGRKTHLPMIHSKNAGERQFAERAAVNAPVQGTSADIIKRAMARMPAALADAGLKATRMLLQVHDELVFEVADAEVAAASAVIKAVMEGANLPAAPLSVPLAVEIGTGASWGDAH